MKKVLLPISIITIAAGVCAAMNMAKPSPLKTESPNVAVAVKTVVPQSTDIRFQVTTQGTVSPRTRTSLISEVAGTVLGVSPKFVVGGIFKRDEVLLWIDPTDYEVALQQAKAKLISMKAHLALEEAKATQARKEWAQTGLTPERAPVLALRTPYLDEARANVLHAEAELKQAQRKLERTKIRAPYDGMVSEKSVDVGQYVSVAGPLGTTFAIDTAEVRLPLTDSDLALLGTPFAAASLAAQRLPTEVTLTAEVGGQETHWTAVLVRSEGVVEEHNRARYVVAEVSDPYGLATDHASPPLLIGSFVTATIAGQRADHVYPVPRNAIREGNKIAVVDSDRRLRLKPVDIVYSDDRFSYVKRGLPADAEVITSALGLPIEGMLVNPVMTASPSDEVVAMQAEGKQP